MQFWYTCIQIQMFLFQTLPLFESQYSCFDVSKNDLIIFHALASMFSAPNLQYNINYSSVF